MADTTAENVAAQFRDAAADAARAEARMKATSSPGMPQLAWRRNAAPPE